MTRHSSLYLPRGVRVITLLISTVVAVLLDQFTKIYAVQNWKELPPMIFLEDLFRIEYAENHGAFLSLLANTPESVRFWILTVINGAVLAGLGGYLLFARRMTLATYLPLLLIVVGGLGNLIDRMRFGYVIDFMNMGIGTLRTGIFNVADIFITAGFILMGYYLIRGEGEEEPSVDGNPQVKPPADQAGPAASLRSTPTLP